MTRTYLGEGQKVINLQKNGRSYSIENGIEEDADEHWPESDARYN